MIGTATPVDNARLSPDTLLTELAHAGADVSRPKSIRCPFHDDRTASGGVFVGDDGVYRYKCQACEAKGDYLDIRARNQNRPVADVLRDARIDSVPTDERVSSPSSTTKKAPKTYLSRVKAESVAAWAVQRDKGAGWVLAHRYKYPDGFVVLRFESPAGDDKTFRPLYEHDAGWSLGDPRGNLPLYRRDQLTDGPVLVVEGEKAADAAAAIGLNVVAASHGSKSADKTDWSPLYNRDVVVWPDADDNGAKFAEAVAKLVPGTRIMPVPDGLAKGDDVFDWIEQRDAQSAEDLATEVAGMIEAAPPAPVPDDPILSTPEQRAERLSQQEKPKKLVALGTVDPESGRVVLSSSKTLPTARAFVRQFYTHDGSDTLVCYADELLAWQGNTYRLIEDGAVRRDMGQWLHGALRYVKGPNGEPELIDFDSNPRSVGMALSSIRDAVHLDATTPTPAWLDGRTSPPAHELLPCKSVNLHLPTGDTFPATPTLFTTSALEFDPVANPPEPAAWLGFLSQLWPDDPDSIDSLQEIFGYLLSGSTALQKMFLLVGPKRSGKGTIGRVLGQLIGKANVAGPTISSLAGGFGCQPLIGKSLAVVSDARFKGEGIHRVVERLLCISGEDPLSVERKHNTSVTMTLPTRFLFLTNELPRFTDASGALAGRFIALVLTESFYGREDPGLLQRLTAELPGILAWALDGQRRLADRGYLVQPASGADEMQEMEDMASPVSAFIRDKCVVGSDERVMVDVLWEAWKTWCEAEGRHTPGIKNTFGRDLKAVLPGVKKRRGTANEHFYDGVGVSYA